MIFDIFDGLMKALNRESHTGYKMLIS